MQETKRMFEVIFTNNIFIIDDEGKKVSKKIIGLTDFNLKQICILNSLSWYDKIEVLLHEEIHEIINYVFKWETCSGKLFQKEYDYLYHKFYLYEIIRRKFECKKIRNQ